MAAALLFAAAAPAQALVEVQDQTSVTFQWAPATGPVAGYLVALVRDGVYTPGDRFRVYGTNQATVEGAYGETVQIWVAAFDQAGNTGPYSEGSDEATFVQTTASSDPAPAPDPEPQPEPAPEPQPEPAPEPLPDVFAGTPFDLDGDGNADLLVQSRFGGAVSLLSLDATGVAAVGDVADVDGEIVGNGDYDGDGTGDILWRDAASGRLSISYMEAGAVSETVVIHSGLASNWEVVGSADYDGDGLVDILLHNTDNNAFERWSLDGNAYAGTPFPNDFGGAADVIASGDFDGDGMADVLWRDAASGEADIWGTTGDLAFDALETGGLFGWSVIGAGDFDGDGRHDLLLRKKLGSLLAVRLAADGSRQQIESALNESSGTRDVVGIGDYDGDGRADLAVSDGNATRIWFLDGAVSTGDVAGPDTTWTTDFANVDWRPSGSR